MLKHNMQQFLKETNRAIEKELEKQEKAGREIVLEALNLINETSPVSTSYFRANNFMTVNSTTDKTLPVGKIDYKAESSNILNDYRNTVKGLKFSKVNSITIQNNVSYADALESGISLQAPSGIYGVTEERIKRYLNQRL